MTENVLTDQEAPFERGDVLNRPLTSLLVLNWENVAWLLLLIVAAVARFYDVGVRVMSHDESLHALYSYYLYDAGNYDHNPMMHGPLLFHMNAFMYFLFGVTDATARIVPALFGMGAIWMARLYRPYIGRTGALIAGVLIAVSPSLLFHSRYIRNDIYIAFFTMLWIYGAFRYLDTRQFRYLVTMILGMAFGFVAKENHFMTGAIIGAFFASLALWQSISERVFIVIAPMIFGAGGWYFFHVRDQDSVALLILGVAGLATVALAVYFLLGNGWSKLRRNSAADLAIVMVTMIMPFASPFPYVLMGWEQPDWQSASTITNDIKLKYGVLVLGLTLAAAAISFFWFGMRRSASNTDEENVEAAGLLDFWGWGQLMLLFWTIEVLFFTTFLTNTMNGLATGIVGSLGYWIAQQEVARGGQPPYYYLMLGSLYEFLPMILSGVGGVVLLYWLFRKPTWDPTPTADLPVDVPRVLADEHQDKLLDEAADWNRYARYLRANRAYFVVFCLWWVIGSWAAYTVAGEKMPWLMVHMALPMCVLGGWYTGRLLWRIDWQKAQAQRDLWLIGASPALIVTLVQVLRSTPNGERSLAELGVATQWILGLIILAGLLYLCWRGMQRIGWRSGLRLMATGLVALLFLLTVRFSYMLNYINYDMATEYLVYAHGGPDIKTALAEIDKISERTVGGRNIEVAYDDDSSWPLSWYMRLYPNNRFYGANPNSDNMKAPVIIVGSKNFDAVRPYVSRDYVKRTYRQVWWPDQGYFFLTWDRFWSTITDRTKMENIFQIVFYRRYRDDADPSKWRDLTQWPQRHEFEMWVRRDIAAEIWDLGVAPVTEDPNSIYAQARAKEISLTASSVYNTVYGDKALLRPRAVAVGQDGTRAIADSGNNRVVILDAAGNFVTAFGSRCYLAEGESSGCVDPDGDGPLQMGDGQFAQYGADSDGMWGIAMAANGEIFVADTWNGRIQVFDSQGQFLRKWGYFNTTNSELGDPLSMFGPRGIALDLQGNLLVADTGNKRILHFTTTGEALNQVGGGGVVGGRFEEPVGVGVDPRDGSVFVADAWNRRIQKLAPDLSFVAEYAVPGWESQEIFHKPYVAVAPNGDIYASDPQMYRIYVYAADGALKAAFGNYGADMTQIGLPTGLAIDATSNSILVADADNNRVMVFPLLP